MTTRSQIRPNAAGSGASPDADKKKVGKDSITDQQSEPVHGSNPRRGGLPVLLEEAVVVQVVLEFLELLGLARVEPFL